MDPDRQAPRSSARAPRPGAQWAVACHVPIRLLRPKQPPGHSRSRDSGSHPVARRRAGLPNGRRATLYSGHSSPPEHAVPLSMRPTMRSSWNRTPSPPMLSGGASATGPPGSEPLRSCRFTSVYEILGTSDSKYAGRGAMHNGWGKVFISHSSKDGEFVDRLAMDLSARGIPVWYDKLDLQVGDSVPGKINQGLAEAKYFLIVLSPEAIESHWVQEELNAALMRQVASLGTFIIPVLLRDCSVPPLLAHRRHADFTRDYERGLSELLSAWSLDKDASQEDPAAELYPWPDIEMPDLEFIYLRSTRFDKFFRMTCQLNWTASKAIDYIIGTLQLPWSHDLSQMGMRWSFSYGLHHQNKAIGLRQVLRDAGIGVGSTLQLSIRGTYEDLFEKELKEMWDGSKMWEISGIMRREAELRAAIKARGPLTGARLRELANSCFAHV